ncbi:hypothetical protein C8J56DRAFT_1062997 [Mycena floridula]|nr:hypothetical protein C8J56DRAFT_1062997 [Mycena floridula]
MKLFDIKHLLSITLVLVLAQDAAATPFKSQQDLECGNGEFRSLRAALPSKYAVLEGASKEL